MPGTGRSPAQIDADIARLQEGIRRARAAARAAGPPQEDTEVYEQAVAEVARATRALVDYEARIPEYEEGFRQRVSARTYRRAGGLLALVCVGLCFAALTSVVSLWWFVLLGPLLLAGLRALPGAGRRAADHRFRPRAAAALFLVSALIAVLCAFGVVIPWAAPFALLAAWAGLYVFGALTPDNSAARRGRTVAPRRPAGPGDRAGDDR